ncbi:MAG TPA: vanadium-dependent haloperoxidase [Longimicrobiales bacterium]|nr:vanadium-dependent haloperoxidase [Longimicrobiales bacterium]
MHTPVKRKVHQAGLIMMMAALTGCDAGVYQPAETPPEALRMNAVVDRATAAERWVALTRTIIGRREFGPLGIARTYALVSVAQYNAVIAAADGKDHGRHPSEAGAAAAAAATVLRAIYPMEGPAIDAQLASDAVLLPQLPSERSADYAAGIIVGEQAAVAVLERAATDGSAAIWSGSIPAGPGFWLNGPPPLQPVSPLWGDVRPWVLESGDQFRPAPPPAFGSAEFIAALTEVRHYTDNVTPEQLEIARFWQGGSGPGGPMGYFGAVASGLAASRNMNERAATRMFAVMYMAIMDASIGCWDAKYAYWYIRPHQADPGIATPVGRPNFPAYPSAHSCLSAAAVGVLRDFFPAETANLNAQVDEAGVARLYAGLHYHFDITAGQELGFAVARLALANAPRGQQAIPLD